MSSSTTTRGKKEAGALTRRLASFVSLVRKADRTTKALWASLACAGVAMGVVLVTILVPNAPGPVETSVTPPAPVARHPLTGEPLSEALTTLPRVFAVMIENAADAWPLAGLQDAFLVIEAPVEGSIPRFEAFFSEDTTPAFDQGYPSKIGPVRSARPYYIDWADELDAVYVHVGGSPDALDLIKQFGTIDLNEFFQGEYFYRWSQRAAPHNAYTTMDNLRASLDELNIGGASYSTWSFKDNVDSGENMSLSIDWTTGTTYDVGWDYNGETYTRNQMGAETWEEHGVGRAASNVVVMATDIGFVPGDDKGRRTLRTTGEGEAMVFQDGRVIVATWKKELRTDRLRFYDAASGEEVAMNAGATWIEVVSSLSQVTVIDRTANTPSE